MTLIVQAAPDCVGVDCNTKVTSAMLDALSSATVLGETPKGIGRYVALHEPESLSDLTPDEIALVTGRGFGLWIVQHCLYPGWTASAALGAQLGKAALDNARKIGIPAGATIFFDAEGVANPGPAMVECLRAWAREIATVYGAGEYVGYDNGETPEQHYYSQPDVHLYWKAPGPWSVAVRGFAMEQELQVVIGGVPYDPDKIGADTKGGRLQWLVAGQSTQPPSAA